MFPRPFTGIRATPVSCSSCDGGIVVVVANDDDMNVYASNCLKFRSFLDDGKIVFLRFSFAWPGSSRKKKKTTHKIDTHSR